MRLADRITVAIMRRRVRDLRRARLQFVVLGVIAGPYAFECERAVRRRQREVEGRLRARGVAVDVL